ncbi:pyridoxamine 5'-phosphate oxidase family protein [uncultured Croceitalea sp.]|uniref:pyridoxamine 5'-phosphate oxidase family protein n=1 Tax=uncultured Croceitalea sp. TaxID=1798908 RepID=UPI00374F4098
MFKEAFEQLKTELYNGIYKKGHPFRYFTLATLNNGIPKQRTVVLRKVNSDLELFFYTHKRSNKVGQLLTNENVSALFYDSKKLLQLQINGNAVIEKEEKILKELWSVIPINSRKDYTTSLAPGSLLKNPNEVDYLSSQNHFCIVKIIPKSIEYLRLKRPNHTRVLFTKENAEWNGMPLVP